MEFHLLDIGIYSRKHWYIDICYIDLIFWEGSLFCITDRLDYNLFYIRQLFHWLWNKVKRDR
jgi:hypothetical protein